MEVIQSVVINLFCYWLATEVEILQTETKPHPGSKVLVDFAISFYVITAAGGLSVLATAFNCLCRYPLYEDSQGESLLDEYEGLEALLPPPPAPDRSLSPNSLPAPPAYSP
ncbi:transmembrane protein 127-like [Mya arenaria]|uniref:transmembrane protein 127-like n=1 Tax=Mya arenaria TaxID=6604 RepID=UPI0022E48CB0|nr:transmembrane protein 127-like [Mya arenaria]